MAHKNVRHPVDAGDVLVESVEVVTQLVANVTLDVGRESSNVVLPQTNTGHIFGEGYGHSILVILWKSKVFPATNKISKHLLPLYLQQHDDMTLRDSNAPEVLLHPLLLVLVWGGGQLGVGPGDVVGEGGEAAELLAAPAHDLARAEEDDTVLATQQRLQTLHGECPHPGHCPAPDDPENGCPVMQGPGS